MSSIPIELRKWERPRLIKQSWLRFVVIVAVLLYLYASISTIQVNWGRIAMGLQRSQSLFADFLRPAFAQRWNDIQTGVLESLTMALVSTVLGIILAFPIAFGAAENIAPRPVYLFFRALISILRSFQEIIIAILFVVMFGFGPLAGMLTLSTASIGFIGKLLAEEIESMDRHQVEAIQSTGASWAQVMVYSVWPQIRQRFIGLGMYRFDINFRESAVIGVVGAGGIGATLTTAFDRYEFGLASAVLIVIVGIVLLTEMISGSVRKRLQ